MLTKGVEQPPQKNVSSIGQIRATWSSTESHMQISGCFLSECIRRSHNCNINNISALWWLCSYSSEYVRSICTVVIIVICTCDPKSLQKAVV